jgi:outer membrane protein W
MRFVVRAFALAALAAVGSAAQAQDSGKGFLFARPDGSFTLRGGFAMANAGSDIFSFATDELTLRRGDFSSVSLGGDLAFSLRSNLDLVLSASYAGTSKRSEFRKWLDNHDLPIEQNTKFARAPITASLKYYLTDRGRSVGSFAWIPSKYAPFVGAGAGLMYYRFQQVGDFVDFDTHNVFSHDYDSSGWAKTAHVLAGFEYSLGTRWSLSTEARYGWAKADLGDDFSGFKPIDLSGFTTSVGLLVRF